MPRFVMFGTANVKPGKAEEFKEWYAKHHLPEILAVPGVVSGRRLEGVESGFGPVKVRFVTIYELETDHPNTVLAEIGRRGAAGEMTMTETIEPEGSGLAFYEPITA